MSRTIPSTRLSAMRLGIPLLWLLSSSAAAFQPTTTTTTRHPNAAVMRRFMSDIPQDPLEKNKNNKNNNNNSEKDPSVWMQDGLKIERFFKPPPPPEDIFVLTGDLLSLCVYGVTDHLMVQVVSRIMVQNTVSDSTHHLSQAASSQAGGALLQAPVWLDMNMPYSNHVLEVNLSNELVSHYSPALEPMGQATCLLIASWLLAGWWHGAFLWRNTLDCRTERALLVTVQTWLTTCALMCSVVFMSQKLCGCDSYYLIQRGDLDYIVDSASVLVLWRYLVSFLLGSGRND